MQRDKMHKTERKMFMSSEKLIHAALAARANAHCPYSGFAVGAALLAESGRVYTGANCESASYGATVCAERAALTAAITAGERRFEAIAIVAGDSPTPPCGICRQLLAEFGEMTVVCADATGENRRVFSLSALLPEAFSLSDPTERGAV